MSTSDKTMEDNGQEMTCQWMEPEAAEDSRQDRKESFTQRAVTD